ncbi:DsrE family protein [Algoriphagus mannitolivorans]|uniref:DsrE family protein n=1 Tax=Algoriphagus mannitolivorans TaxID=226504 RepID=UPI000425A030|nr:DsrE family protein [Algoriphagus mannitolivorans]
MKSLFKTCVFLLFLVVSSLSFSQTPQFPIVKGYGGIYEIPEATERPDPSKEYKIIVDLTSAAEDNKQISRWVDNVARMMNLHGLAGVSKENLKVKVIIHGGAIYTLLTDENYKKRYEVDNPNIKVLEALKEGGADIMVCGQSLIARNLKQEDLWPGVRIAHSALTTITTYVPQGYVLLKF